ncbi:MAG: aldehyde ferredoxin oxidoreductase N-terminal domain-containing protein [Chloroflexota bacterium]
MPTQGGYAGKVLRVDLGRETLATEPLPAQDILRRYVGGTGLGLYYLLKEAAPDIAPTDSEAPLIFMLGPLTGTPAVNSSDWAIVCYNFCIPYSAGVGHGHGYWGAYLKHAGYDGILIRGRSRRPLYLWIDDDKVELRDARHLWGLDTRETERRIKLELGDEEGVSVACIGPAGEAVLPGASVKADRNHGVSEGSPGAIMGSKNLKAIAVRGTGTVPLYNAQGLVEASAEWERNLCLDSSGTFTHDQPASVGLQNAGITRNYYDRLSKAPRVVGKNMPDPLWGAEFSRRYVEACSRWRVTPRPSYNCLIACAYDVEITDGPFAGFVGSPCGGAGNMEGAAAAIGVDDPSAVVLLSDFYDAMGLESGTFGSIMGAVYQAYNEGILTLEDTDGLDLAWGNWKAAMELVEKAIHCEGIVAELAGGTKALPAALGMEKCVIEDMRKRVLDVEGAGVVMHDHRQFWSVLFGDMVAGTGPYMQGDGTDMMKHPEIGYFETTPGVAYNIDQALSKLEAVRITQFAKLWWDCIGVCMFAARGVKDSVHLASKCLAQSVGWQDFGVQEALEVGERVTTLMRLVYARRGFRKADEFDVSPKHLEPPPVGPAKGRSLAPYLPAMVDEYYRQMGWNVETGLPTADTLRRLGLEEFAGSLP